MGEVRCRSAGSLFWGLARDDLNGLSDGGDAALANGDSGLEDVYGREAGVVLDLGGLLGGALPALLGDEKVDEA